MLQLLYLYVVTEIRKPSKFNYVNLDLKISLFQKYYILQGIIYKNTILQYQ